MKTEKLTLTVSDSIGKVSAELMIPEKMKALLVLAHGAGAGMQHTFMVTLSKGLEAEGIGTLRYNFPYMENKKGRPDVPAVAEKTVESAIMHAQKLFPKTPIYAGGKSFGGRMTSQYTSKNNPDFLRGLIFFGFPLHAPGKASTDRATHLSDVKKPMLFLQGTRDALADLTLIKQVTSKLKNTTLSIFEGADHSFKAGKNVLIPELVKASAEWVEKVAG
jgi:uncharacterized protein